MIIIAFDVKHEKSYLSSDFEMKHYILNFYAKLNKTSSFWKDEILKEEIIQKFGKSALLESEMST